MRPQRHSSAVKVDSAGATRASVTFPDEIYRALEAIARDKKVSVAWVVREAAETYVSQHVPASKAENKK